ncbi:nuclear transport factor 2 family protein [Emticicia sp. BO119]|uniref:nuclear transport factor 2 family protein n=1 Tax=Emticicia sp. BO119 TaxID=2757768 RepID=UPI0015F0C89F|nr:nuclear transport factor 2 family protein [Emticicia sp. BO119]MBA4854023.1 nuclear transport factor 2 family protein [Emticicia sp. BO119]
MKTIKLLSIFTLFAIMTSAAQSPELIKKNVMAAYESLNKRDFAMFKTVCTPDFIEYSAGPTPIKGIDDAIEAYKVFMSIAPDIMFKITNITVDGKRAIVEVEVAGTNTAPVMGMLPPTGKQFWYKDVDFVTFNEKGLATGHSATNPNEVFRQIGYGFLENPHTQSVMNLYQAFSKADVNGIVANINEKVSWDITDNPIVKNAKVYTSKSEIPMFFKELADACEPTKFEPYRFAADGDDVFAVIHVEWKSKANGKTWASNFSHHFKFANGKISEFRELTSKPWEVKGNMTGMK